jgi:plasmid stabilization system protein ParE
MTEYAVIWSPTAKHSYFKILEYLASNWSNKEVNTFIKRTKKALQHLSNNPLLYPFSNQSNTHKCVVAKQVTLFYTIEQKEIQLLIFWDNRQDFDKLISLLGG